MIEETSSRAFDALLSYGIAGVFSFAFLAMCFYLMRFGMNEVKSSFQLVHQELHDLSQKVMDLSVLVAKLEENVKALLGDRNRQ